ncbi:MAG: heme-binding protein [Actinomycetes bacterium]
MTQEQLYTVERSYGKWELRRYAPHVLAEVDVQASFESAGSIGFRPLVSYISGRNVSGEKLAMTAPVIQSAPSRGSGHAVSFVLPADATLETVPAPQDSSVNLRAVTEEWAAAEKFSGRWTEKTCDDVERRLRAGVEKAGLTASGPSRFARYDPPWTPWFMRRNEVVIPVQPPN